MPNATDPRYPAASGPPPDVRRSISPDNDLHDDDTPQDPPPPYTEFDPALPLYTQVQSYNEFMFSHTPDTQPAASLGFTCLLDTRRRPTFTRLSNSTPPSPRQVANADPMPCVRQLSSSIESDSAWETTSTGSLNDDSGDSLQDVDTPQLEPLELGANCQQEISPSGKRATSENTSRVIPSYITRLIDILRGRSRISDGRTTSQEATSTTSTPAPIPHTTTLPETQRPRANDRTAPRDTANAPPRHVPHWTIHERQVSAFGPRAPATPSFTPFPDPPWLLTNNAQHLIGLTARDAALLNWETIIERGPDRSIHRACHYARAPWPERTLEEVTAPANDYRTVSDHSLFLFSRSSFHGNEEDRVAIGTSPFTEWRIARLLALLEISQRAHGARQ